MAFCYGSPNRLIQIQNLRQRELPSTNENGEHLACVEEPKFFTVKTRMSDLKVKFHSGA